MPCGAKPAGRLGSVNEPASDVAWNVVSNTSILLLRKLAANRNVPPLLLTVASPLYTADAAELSTTLFALLAPVHAARMPSSVSKMNPAPPKFPLLLATMPVGHPGEQGCTEAVGIVTTNACLFPCASYKVDTPLLLSAIQNGAPGMKATPHELES